MRVSRWSVLVQTCCMAPLLWFSPGEASAEEGINRDGLFFAGVAGGYGLVKVHTENGSENSEGTFALGFRGGYAINSAIMAGVELNGWTLKAYDYNDPSKGESVSDISIFINYFPFNQSVMYFTGGVGQISYTNNSPAVNGRDKGGSWFVGGGYEYKWAEKISVVPQIRYSQGNFTGGSFNVYEIAIGVNWYSGANH